MYSQVYSTHSIYARHSIYVNGSEYDEITRVYVSIILDVSIMK